MNTIEARAMLSQDFTLPKQLEYLSAKPFPHICLKNMWNQEQLSNVASSVEDFDDWDGEKKFYGSIGKRWCSDRSKLPEAVLSFIDYANSPKFLKKLESITGEKGLIPDPFLEGGGVHSTSSGGFLKMHVDFNWQATLKVYRRLNLLVYLNSDWSEDWGGELKLGVKSHDSPLEISKVIFPHMNTTVLFTTDENSFHGQPDPLGCPKGINRNSIALYYYIAQPRSLNSVDVRVGTDYVTTEGQKISHFRKFFFWLRNL